MSNNFNKNKLSVVIITFNEERNISRCLKSVSAIADEIIVVDSFSTDNTESICNQFKVRFVQANWLGYSETKNYANSLALYDYIFSLDADEEVSEVLQKSILKQKQIGFVGVYSMNRLTNYCGSWVHHTSWYPDTKVRIVNKYTSCWEGNVHEVLQFADKPSIQHLKGDILHYSFYTINEHKAKIVKYATIAVNTMISEGKSFSYFKLIVNPLVKFIKDYFIKLGFLDGSVGFTVSKMNAYGTYLKYDMLRKAKSNL